MRLGDPYTFTPSAFEGEAEERQDKKSKQAYLKPRRLTGRVVYLHPRGRFFTVEARCGAAVIRESFLLYRERG